MGHKYLHDKYYLADNTINIELAQRVFLMIQLTHLLELKSFLLQRGTRARRHTQLEL